MLVLSGLVLNWFCYLFGKSFSKSTLVPLECAVPQGSILGSLLDPINMRPLGHFYQQTPSVTFLCRWPSQLNLSFDNNDTNQLRYLHMCIVGINNLMASNFLQLNRQIWHYWYRSRLISYVISLHLGLL